MIIMNKNKVLFLLLAHLCVLSVWGQGFGKRILTNEDWYFNLLLSAKTQKGINIPPEAL